MTLQKVKAVQDNDLHWYVIPEEMEDQFNLLLEGFGLPHSAYSDITDELYEERGRREEQFDNMFSKYMTGGDLNLVQLYADIT